MIPKNISKNVFVLGVVSLLTDISSEMLYPVIPIFLTSVLGAPMSVVGLIEGIAEATASVLKGVSGWLSDFLGKRRVFVVGGYSLSAIAKPFFYLSYVWPTVLVGRFLDRFGKGLRGSARDAIIADSSDAAFRGKAFGFHRAMDSIGAVIGPLLAILILSVFKDNIRVIFLIAFVPAAAGVATLVFFLKEPPALARTNEGVRASFRQLDGPFRKFLIVTGLFAIGNSSDVFLIMRAKDLGLTTMLTILAYVVFNVFNSASATYVGALSDRLPRKVVMIAGYLIFSIVYFGFAFARVSGAVWVLFAVYGFYMAMTDGVGKALVSDLVAAKYRATAIGFSNALSGILAFFASLFAGLLWTHVGAAAPFIFGGAMALAAAGAFTLLVRPEFRVKGQGSSKTGS